MYPHEYLNFSIKRFSPTFDVEKDGFKSYEFEVVNDEVFPTQSNTSIYLEGLDLTDIPFKFGNMPNTSLDISDCNISTLAFLPRVVKVLDASGLLDKNKKLLPPTTYIPILLVTVNLIIVNEKQIELDQILNKDRVNGKMPRELIPTKINQLRGLDGR
jgi:hypothetical protein